MHSTGMNTDWKRPSPWDVGRCPLCAKSGHSALQLRASSFDHLVGAARSLQCRSVDTPNKVWPMGGIRVHRRGTSNGTG